MRTVTDESPNADDRDESPNVGERGDGDWNGDDWTTITPTASFANWTRLPYTFTVPPRWLDDLAGRGVSPQSLRTTPLSGPSQWSLAADDSDAEGGDDGGSGDAAAAGRGDEGRRLVCSGEGPHMWLRYDEPLGDFRAHVEWRFAPQEPHYGYNSGVFVRNDAAADQFYQVETGATEQTAGFLFTKEFVDGEKRPVYGSVPTDDGPVPFHPRRPDLPECIAPPGEWNTYDVHVEGSRAELWTNGVHTSVFEGIENERGHFGLEAEGYRIEFRNVRIQRLD